ncbi:hypothetical protein TYRP_010059 [Tyrophagus putrescentiae]|nr:hypothetical protein TYRP_010059 [Tyrophagus putrescentiae]
MAYINVAEWTAFHVGDWLKDVLLLQPPLPPGDDQETQRDRLWALAKGLLGKRGLTPFANWH